MRQPVASGCALSTHWEVKKAGFPAESRRLTARRRGGVLIRRLGFAALGRGFCGRLWRGPGVWRVGGEPAFGASSGLALACLAAGFAFGSDLASLPVSLASAFGSAAASGFLAAICDFFFPRGRSVCFCVSTATAAIRAAPVFF